MYAEMLQLAAAYSATGSKEEVFVRQVVSIGELLRVPVTQIWLPSCEKYHHCVAIQDVAQHLLDFYPRKLLAGHTSSNIGDFKHLLKEFWKAYAKVYPSHPVFTDHANALDSCIPMKIHSDEGTGLRRTAVQQYSWGPILSHSGCSLDKYFFFSCLNAEQYKAYNFGYAVGNAVLDDVCEHFATQATKAYTDGILSSLGKYHLVFVGLEGDLPAQARIYRLCRNFSHAPNCMCPWCEANDSTVPFTDSRDCAKWRETVHASRPWNTEGPLLHIPGGNDEIMLAKDIFHLCHLGAVRGFVVNTLCYLVAISLFVSGLQINFVCYMSLKFMMSLNLRCRYNWLGGPTSSFIKESFDINFELLV